MPTIFNQRKLIGVDKHAFLCLLNITLQQHKLIQNQHIKCLIACLYNYIEKTNVLILARVAP